MVISHWIAFIIKKINKNLQRNSKHFLYSINILRNSVFYEIMCKKDNRDKQSTECSVMWHWNNPLCILDKGSYRHTLRLCNICWVYTPIIIKRTHIVIPYTAVHVFFSNMLTEQLIHPTKPPAIYSSGWVRWL
jgi:hypothetical protein